MEQALENMTGNGSQEFLAIHSDGQTYFPSKEMYNVQTGVSCSSGRVRAEAACGG